MRFLRQDDLVDRLFRNEVIEAARDRLTGTVVAAVPPTSRLYTRLVLAGAAMLLLFLVFGSYASSADVGGVVAYDTGIARVYPRVAGEVRRIHVRSGQRVVAGQAIATLALAQGAAGVSPQMSQLVAQDAEIARQVSLAAEQGDADVRGLDRQQAGLAGTIAALQRQRAIAAGQIALAQSAAKRAIRLAGEGAGTQRQVEDSRSTVLARQAELAAIEERLIAQRDTLLTNRSDRAKRAIETRRTQSELLGQRAKIGEQRASLSRDAELTLAAPVSGVIGDISVEIGQQATPSQSIASVVPEGGKLEIWLYAPSRAVGNAHIGQKVRLHFDAFPFQKFGSGEGVVSDIASVPSEPQSVDPGLKISEPVFRLRTRIVRFPRQIVSGRGSLRPGMTVSGKLMLERRSLWQVLFGPLFQATMQ